jgi:hypothetical protein
MMRRVKCDQQRRGGLVQRIPAAVQHPDRDRVGAEGAPRTVRPDAKLGQADMQVDGEAVAIPNPGAGVRSPDHAERDAGPPNQLTHSRSGWRATKAESLENLLGCAGPRWVDQQVDVGVGARARAAEQQLIKRRSLEQDRPDPSGGERRCDLRVLDIEPKRVQAAGVRRVTQRVTV